jgi:uncharacterized membrane protein YkgB
MQNFSNQQQPQQTPQQPKPQPQKAQGNALLSRLDVIGSIVMIIGLFIGNFYKADAGAYAGGYEFPGYKLIFNGDYMLGTLFIVVPAVVLITNYVAGLKKYDKLIKFVLPIVSLIFVFVLKGQVTDGLTSTAEGAKLAVGGLLYTLGNLVALVGGATAFFGVDLADKIAKK